MFAIKDWTTWIVAILGATHPARRQQVALMRPLCVVGQLPQGRPIETCASCTGASTHLPRPQDGSTLLPYGLGRSYGDSCLNDGGTLLDTTRLDHFIEFDRADRSSCAARPACIAVARSWASTVPHGWFLPVTPGTKLRHDRWGRGQRRARKEPPRSRHVRTLRHALRAGCGPDGERLSSARPEENTRHVLCHHRRAGPDGPLMTWVEFPSEAHSLGGAGDRRRVRSLRQPRRVLRVGRRLGREASNTRWPGSIAWPSDAASRSRDLHARQPRGPAANGGEPSPPRLRLLACPVYAPGTVC